MMVGTPAYVSPEQAAGETNLDGKSDQYSLACVVYEMLTGERPFNGPTPQSVMAKRFAEMPRPLRQVRSSVPETVERAVTKAMAIDPTARYASSAHFGQALASSSLETPTDTATIPHTVVSAAKSVAVLPFTNMSNDPENEYFTDGMAEEIINALNKVQSLRVAARTSSFAFKGKNEDVGEIGRKLKVSTVLEGSVRKMGNRLRITAQLVNVADGYHLWSERYDREMEDVFAIQDDISQAIVKALKVILSEGEKKQIEKVRAENVQAYDYYLRGRQYYQIHRKSLEYARQMFNRAVETDPDYARAYAGVADSCSLLYMYFDARDYNLRQADAASAKALELEPDLAEAHVARGLAISLSKRFREAEQEFETAMKLDPKLFEAAYWYGRALMSEGRMAEAARMFERASALRPEDYQAPNFLAQAYNSMGNEEQADAANRRSVRLMEEQLERNPSDARAANLLAATYANFGDRDKATEYVERSLSIDPDDAMLLYNAACTYALLGRTDEAIGFIERAVDKGFGHKEWIDHDPDLNALRENPRFQTISKAM
jgi:TolB-like protein/Flp pilus assembly protein TadD